MKHQASLVFRRGKRYVTSMRWLVQRAILRRRVELLWLAALSVVSLGAQALAVVTIFTFVRLMEGREPVPLIDLPVEWARSHQGLIAVVILVAALLVLNHFTLFRIRMIGIDWACDTEKDCARLALGIAARLPDLSQPAATAKATDPELLRILTVDARYCGMTVRLMVRSVPVLIALAGAVIGLLVVDWAITATIIALGFVIFLFQYPANVKGADATRRWQLTRPASNRQMMNAIQDLRSGSRQDTTGDGGLGDPYEHPDVDEAMDAYAQRMQSIELGTLSTQMGTTAIIAAIILFIGGQALRGDTDWAFLITYVTLLRVASSNFSGFARSTTSMARLYPQVQTVASFVLSANSQRLEPLQDSTWAMHVTISDPEVAEGEGPKVGSVLESNQFAAIVSRGLREYARPDFAVALAADIRPSQHRNVRNDEASDFQEGDAHHEKKGSQGAVVIVACGRRGRGDSVRSELALPPCVSDEGWLAALEQLRRARPDLGSEIAAVAKLGLDGGLSAPAPAVRGQVIVQLAAARVRRASVVIVERAALEALGCRGSDDPLVRLLRRGSLVLVWYQGTDLLDGQMPDLGEEMALVCDGTNLETCIDLLAHDAVKRLGESLTRSETKADEAREAAGDRLDESVLEVD